MIIFTNKLIVVGGRHHAELHHCEVVWNREFSYKEGMLWFTAIILQRHVIHQTFFHLHGYLVFLVLCYNVY